MCQWVISKIQQNWNVESKWKHFKCSQSVIDTRMLKVYKLIWKDRICILHSFLIIFFLLFFHPAEETLPLWCMILPLSFRFWAPMPSPSLAPSIYKSSWLFRRLVGTKKYHWLGLMLQESDGFIEKIGLLWGYWLTFVLPQKNI